MKNAILFFVIAVLLLGCTNKNGMVAQDPNVATVINFTETIDDNADLENTNRATEITDLSAYNSDNGVRNNGNYPIYVIPNDDAAVEVATAIFNHMEKDEEASNYSVKLIMYVDYLEEYHIVFGEADPDLISLKKANSIKIALNEKTGEVTSIWITKID